jgi:hypothetical protein
VGAVIGRIGRRAWLLTGLGLVAATIVAWLIVSQVTAAGGGLKRQGYAAAAFTAVVDSTHNNNGNSVCAAFVPSQQGAENRGDLNARKGSFAHAVQLPQGATVRQLVLWVNDADADDDAFVFLLRKRIRRGLSPQFKGYQVMARTQSNGAVTNRLRKFVDSSISGARVNNRRYYYYLELVNCANVEPFAVQIGVGG